MGLLTNVKVAIDVDVNVRVDADIGVFVDGNTDIHVGIPWSNAYLGRWAEHHTKMLGFATYALAYLGQKLASSWMTLRPAHYATPPVAAPSVHTSGKRHKGWKCIMEK